MERSPARSTPYRPASTVPDMRAPVMFTYMDQYSGGYLLTSSCHSSRPLRYSAARGASTPVCETAAPMAIGRKWWRGCGLANA